MGNFGEGVAFHDRVLNAWASVCTTACHAGQCTFGQNVRFAMAIHKKTSILIFYNYTILIASKLQQKIDRF